MDQAAPYKIKKQGDKFVVVNNMDVVKASFDSEEAARQYQKALYANVPKAPETAARKSFTGKQKRPIKVTNPESAVEKILRLSGR